MSQIPSKLSSIIRPLYEFLFPPVCFGCDASLQDGERKICAWCRTNIRTISPEDELYREMRGRLMSTGWVDGLISAFYFEKEGTLQSLIHQLKYDGMTSLGVELGRMLGERIQLILKDAPTAGLIPVPLHPTKRRERGYNQSEFVARGIHEVTGLHVLPTVLQRRKYTQSQTQLTIEERKQNVTDAFTVRRSALGHISERTFLVIDDVITTGATVEACARILKQHGASRVIACSVALADHAAIP